MNIKSIHFNSKLLLFGEYGLMFNAMALSVPFARFSGSLAFSVGPGHENSHREIRKFFIYLSSLEKNSLHYPFNLKNLEEDMDNGLWFHSNIPIQYGLGSSGALIAALFSRYAAPSSEKDKLSIESLKEDFALLESHFHGKSSGLDPLVSFLNKPLLLDSDKAIKTIAFDLSKTGWSFGLIDTRTTGATGVLVKHFMESLQQPVFKSAFESAFIPSSDGCINALLKGDTVAFFQSLELLIHFELQYFRQMIPHSFNELISEALSQKVYIKLLGSGGGGYLLAISPAESILREWADKQAIQLLKIA